MNYETNRDEFEKIVKNYREYVKLYMAVTGGSIEGLSSFADFYWRVTFHGKYSDPSVISELGN